jgi:hypothetical protein
MKKKLFALVLACCLVPLSALAQSAIDGTWKVDNKSFQAPEKAPKSESRVIFKTANGMLSMSSPDGGGSYSAKLDGTQAPLKGEPGARMVSVKMKDPLTMEEVTYRDGKPVLTFTMSVDAGGKRAKVSWKNMTNQASGGYSMDKQ